MAGPCDFVIFGATGHLTTTKLLPALFHLESAGRLDPELRFVAFARREWNRDAWLRHLEQTLAGQIGGGLDRERVARFCGRFDYVRGDLADPQSYQSLKRELGRPRAGSCENIVFYLAVRPIDFPTVVARLDEAGFNRRGARQRIVVEKPFGVDLASARRLNGVLDRSFDEGQVFRIDHYLGKETVQNLFVFRFANTLVEPVWNRHYVDHVQITVAERAGIETRAGYYDGAGALRDMLQNHLLQLLSVVAMEPPASLDADALRDEKVKVLRSIRPIPGGDLDAYAVRAQYAGATTAGRRFPAYREEDGVAPGSNTETYVAVRFLIDNWRWRNVPFYLRTGKRLAEDRSLVAIRFKHPPQQLFRETPLEHAAPNWIVHSVQPEESMHIELHARQPGHGMDTRVVRLDTMFRHPGERRLDAYETLLLDVIDGDRSLFIRFDEVEWAWRVMDPILQGWAERAGAIPTYPAGSWGPAAADRILERADQAWRNDL
jgi:glucose-6-phosphate 1-dehydrogenase